MNIKARRGTLCVGRGVRKGKEKVYVRGSRRCTLGEGEDVRQGNQEA